ncbi:MAG: ABC transporter permease [Mesorhizobium sp.]|uniref:ABC transporter permease n=1 Tax=Mesorhizobium wenxiniae TaxID=2014805 RepID=A0A271KNA2_9HYPH|nr:MULTISPECIES: ABC transporter permease [Mesorhizobium]MCF6115120.1 ABC transporter permease [Mesorhizobium muleiense]PAP97156.1 ABC transporter permease [Mesorhizobium wenxiniae]RVD17320.1 ABC transporter permease [Mesorhizobium sp. M7A.F.Ca.ET.027.02.1.1]RWC98866.1 MAG: ABC transporter permease [Mesorhizobium sp.]RWD45722.1 MAG: ABC transporter permease [Mesorhizobium sp.]
MVAGLRTSSTLLGIAVFVFLYAPLALLVAYSFSASRTLTFPIRGFTFEWYAALANNEELLRAVANSLKVAAGVVFLTLLLGIPAAYALSRFAFRGSALVDHMLTLPLMIPGIITGLSILLLLKSFGFGLSLGAVALGHSVAWLPIVVEQVAARLRRLDRSIEEASLDLGAGYAQTFVRAVLPNLKGAITGSALLVFTLSFDEVSITFLLTATENTLSMQIWAMLRQGVTPEICAIATITVAFSGALIGLGVGLARS